MPFKCLIFFIKKTFLYVGYTLRETEQKNNFSTTFLAFSLRPNHDFLEHTVNTITYTNRIIKAIKTIKTKLLLQFCMNIYHWSISACLLDQ